MVASILPRKRLGVYVYDSEGRKYLDALAGLWSTALGGSEERLVRAADEQMRKLPYYHSFWNRTTEPALALAKITLWSFAFAGQPPIFDRKITPSQACSQSALVGSDLYVPSFGLMNIFSRPSGGIISDLVARRFGMRGRLWALWMFQTLGGVFCITMGFMDTLSSSIAVMIVFSFFVEAACGMTFGIIPFISRRSLGIVSGMTGAGGNLGSAVTQASFFTKNPWTTETGLKYMGIMIVGVCQLLWLMHFPQWGGMLFPASKKSNATEEGYYGGEYNEDEKAKGLHVSSMKFAENAKGERGAKGTLNAEEADARKPTEV
eukprot:jgi/Mesen1/829/ME000111S10974